ncbi:hypothetical protein N7448_006261 [Penicillium atrosanguineum]|uniref:Uncharacterized protein n=1 Tax=Penicillium atrosanguineum TaxID=1132637 RepID=A0A9W9GY33_9EURO|nr:uncharacterized protein N7443_010022 [Penicillium atrosanguineum]KAJ5132103.1 hypothetical protein N7448_006261 [Penicillium atrosanguineum]KAJ5137687.1 hypothetical protein N7526_003920 [Penicillium atrosanguineum]KAJ5289769.1 hypothetical protein N7443_010022 [Penicillium atrosanguineum]KAJ5307591.1 hypothetical protein N7476_008247 [Penicillium atrosanguineum]
MPHFRFPSSSDDEKFHQETARQRHKRTQQAQLSSIPLVRSVVLCKSPHLETIVDNPVALNNRPSPCFASFFGYRGSWWAA